MSCPAKGRQKNEASSAQELGTDGAALYDIRGDVAVARLCGTVLAKIQRMTR